MRDRRRNCGFVFGARPIYERYRNNPTETTLITDLFIPVKQKP